MIAMLISAGFSVPAYHGDIEFKQSDGSTFTGNLKGDEYFSWVEDKSGHIIQYNDRSKDYEYGIIAEVNGSIELVPSGSKVGASNSNGLASASSSAPIMDLNRSQIFEIWKRKRAERDQKR